MFPWQRELRQTVAVNTKYRILQGGVSYPGAESDKTELDLASYRLHSQNSFKEHPIVEVLKC
jgi:hypothetical protein